LDRNIFRNLLVIVNNCSGVSDDDTNKGALGCCSSSYGARLWSCVVSLYPGQGTGVHWFRFWFSYRFSVLLPSLSLSVLLPSLSLSVLPGALLSAGTLLLPTSLLSSADILPAERLSDVRKHCSTDYLYVAAGLDRCARSILQGIQIDPGYRQSCHRVVWYLLSRCERPMALRQLMAELCTVDTSIP
jgi:hypothetical protein